MQERIDRDVGQDPVRHQLRRQRHADEPEQALSEGEGQPGEQAGKGAATDADHNPGFTEAELLLCDSQAAVGSRNQNRVRPLSDSAPTWPPTASTSCFTIARPMPAPPRAVSRDFSTR